MPSSGCQTCALDRKSTRLNSSQTIISYAVFCLKKKEDRLVAGQGHRVMTYATDAAPARAPSSGATCPGSPPRASLPPSLIVFFFLNDRATPEFYPLPHPDALPF